MTCSGSEGLVSVINDACRSVIVLILNGILNVCHEILKFSLILFLVYYMGMWIFRFWDAILDGTMPTVSQLLTQNEAVDLSDPNRNWLQKLELQEDIKEIQSDFENFIKAELRDSNLSLGVKPRSSQFEQLITASIRTNDKVNANTNQLLHENPKSSGVTSQQLMRGSQPQVSKPLSVPINMNANSNIYLNRPNRSNYSFDTAVKSRKETDTQRIPSYDDQTNHESFHRV